MKLAGTLHLKNKQVQLYEPYGNEKMSVLQHGLKRFTAESWNALSVYKISY